MKRISILILVILALQVITLGYLFFSPENDDIAYSEGIVDGTALTINEINRMDIEAGREPSFVKTKSGGFKYQGQDFVITAEMQVEPDYDICWGGLYEFKYDFIR